MIWIPAGFTAELGGCVCLLASQARRLSGFRIQARKFLASCKRGRLAAHGSGPQNYCKGERQLSSKRHLWLGPGMIIVALANRHYIGMPAFELLEKQAHVQAEMHEGKKEGNLHTPGSQLV